ncbi:MAG TPA: hypothetical protein VLM87_00530, partial [Rubrivivax sp.]|nr:hypothetical protein [Rubrivivax sp.]
MEPVILHGWPGPRRTATMQGRAQLPILVIRRHRFEAPDNRRLAHLCGPLDAHLRAIESALGVRLARREASFRIDGPRGAVDSAVALLDALYEKAREPIGERALQSALARAVAAAVPSTDGAPEPAEASLVLHTPHADLSGRTPN